MKNDEMLDVLDRIDEDILDRNAKKRCTLWARISSPTRSRSGRSKNIAIVLLAATLALTVVAFGALLVLYLSDQPIEPPVTTEPLPTLTESIISIEKTSSDGDMSVYTITYENGTTATLDITDKAPDGSGAKITGVTFDENSNVYLSLATGKLLSMGQAVGQSADNTTLSGYGGRMTLTVTPFLLLGNTAEATAVAGVSVDEEENMSYRLNNGKHLALGKVHHKGEGDKDTSMSMACINEAGELVLGFASGETVNLGRVVGKDGKDGVGIAGISLSDEGDLSVTLTSGTILNLGNIKGQDGIGIAESKINDNGELVLTYTDGNSVNLGRVVGERGEDGVGIASINISDAGELTISLTDGTSLNLGIIKGQDGKSAYELYKEKYGYEGTEEEWLFDLVNGNLSAKIKHPVTFDSAGGSEVAMQEIEEGGKVIEPEVPTRAGYTFKGWYYGEELWSFAGYSVTEPITLTAKWEIVTYTVYTPPIWLKYLQEGDSIPTSYTVEDILRIPDLALDAFAGWTYEGQDVPQKGLVFPAGTITQNITLSVTLYSSDTLSFDTSPLDEGTWIGLGVWGHDAIVTQNFDAKVYAVADATVLAITKQRTWNGSETIENGMARVMLGINNNEAIIYYDLLSPDLPEYIYVGAEVSKGDVIGQVGCGWFRDTYESYEDFAFAHPAEAKDPNYWIYWEYGCTISIFTDFSTPLTQDVFTGNPHTETLANLFLREYDAENLGLWAYLTPEGSKNLKYNFDVQK